LFIEDTFAISQKEVNYTIANIVICISVPGSVTEPAVSFVRTRLTFVASKLAVALCLTLSSQDQDPSESIISIQYQSTFDGSFVALHSVKLIEYLVHLCVVPLLYQSLRYHE
jgi:hypothetical protein